MVRIRMRRVGGKKQASFRIVAADKESPRDGRFIEILGFYNPRTEPATIQLKEDRIYDWISKGAQPSESAMQVFKVAGLIERFERFKAGEDVEKLVAEAEQAAIARNANPKTRHPAPESAPGNQKSAAKAAAAQVAAAQAEEAPVETAEVEAPVEAETSVEAEAPAEDAEPVEAAEAETPAEEAEPVEAAEAETPAEEVEPVDAAEAEAPVEAEATAEESAEDEAKEE